MDYRHTQTTRFAPTLFVLAFLAAAVVMLVSGASMASIGAAVLAFAAIVLVIMVFSTLTVRVDRERVTAAFAWGWPRRTIELDDVVAARPVRNAWWYGWGLRKVPRGWMYNVWGLDAVELVLPHERVFRIGTDEPDDLLEAIAAATGGRIGR